MINQLECIYESGKKINKIEERENKFSEIGQEAKKSFFDFWRLEYTNTFFNIYFSVFVGNEINSILTRNGSVF